MKTNPFAVFFNEQKPLARSLAQEVVAFLQGNGLETKILTSLETLADQKINLLICLGGDGTMLRCARAAAPLGLPVFGINCGTLGFLASCEREDFKKHLQLVLQEECHFTERFMLEAKVFAPDEPEQKFLAFNDCVLRAANPRAFILNASFNGREIPSYFGDGVIISTPTGSTAYSLAAGGPIVEPGVDVQVVTPICPHTLNQRPIILPAEGILELVPEFKNEADLAVLSIDGQINLTLPKNARVQLTRSPIKAKLFCTQERDFFAILSRKLKWGSR